jgi:hypothetical protein
VRTDNSSGSRVVVVILAMPSFTCLHANEETFEISASPTPVDKIRKEVVDYRHRSQNQNQQNEKQDALARQVGLKHQQAGPGLEIRSMRRVRPSRSDDRPGQAGKNKFWPTSSSGVQLKRNDKHKTFKNCTLTGFILKKTYAD